MIVYQPAGSCSFSLNCLMERAEEAMIPCHPYQRPDVGRGSADSAGNISAADIVETRSEMGPALGLRPGPQVSPYSSSLFSDLKGRRLKAYKAEFTRVIEEALNRFHPDLIHTNHLFLLSAMVRKRFSELPMVTTCHGTELRQYELCRHLRSFVRDNCRHIDKIIALSEKQKEQICRLYEIPSDKITVTGGGYDDTLFTRGPQRSSGTVQLLYAGKLNRSKGVPWLLRSLMKMMDKDWHLHMAGGGTGPEYEDCIELDRQLGTRVTLHGFISHVRLAELMKLAHVQVLPSFFEGLPLVLFEGLASGCRIITTDLPGFREVFGEAERTTVHLIPLPPLESIDRPFQEDEAHLIETLCKSLLDMMTAVRHAPDYNDPQAEKIAANYTWSRVFERTLAVYREVLDDHRLRNCKGIC